MHHSDVVRRQGFTKTPILISRLLILPALLTLLGSPLIQAQPICFPTPPGLIAWWRMENNAQDSAGTNHGTIVGSGTAFTNSIVNSGFRGLFVSRHIQIPHSSTLTTTQGFSLEFWALPIESISGPPISKYSTRSGGASWLIEPAGDGRLRFQVDGDGIPLNGVEREVETVDPILPRDGTFRHLAFTCDPALQELKIYVNGSEVPTTLRRSGSITQVFPSEEPIRMGGFGSSQGANVTSSRFDGILDEVSLYNRVLSPAEIQSIANAGTAGKCPPPFPVALQNGTSSRTQGGFSVPATQDGILASFNNGWAPDHQPSTAVWETVSDLALTPNSEILFKVYQLYPFAFHTIGRYRLSYTIDPRSEFADGLQNGGDVTANWIVMPPVSITASNSTNFTTLEDGSILVGTSTPTTVHEVRVDAPTNAITGFRLEVMEHPSLPANGPGFAGNKNLVLTEFEIFALPGAGGSQVTPLTLNPLSTQLVVKVSTTFTGNGGVPPYNFSLTTNNSGASINQFTGLYVGGSIPNVQDTIRIKDSLGNSAFALVQVLPDPTPKPDLALHSFLVPTAATSGAPVELVWVVTNRGNAPATSAWTENLFLSQSTNPNESQFLSGFRNSITLEPGSSFTRTQKLTLPSDSPAGSTRFLIQIDSSSAIDESDESNNIVSAPDTTTVPLQLFLTPTTAILNEGVSATFSVTRNGSRNQPLIISLNSSDTTEISVPNTVSIPVGLAFANFTVTAVSDGQFDGPQSSILSAQSSGFISATVPIAVPDKDTPQLTLSLQTNQLLEGTSTLVTVQKQTISTTPTVIELTSSGGQIAFPTLVTIPANTNAATFDIVAVGDTAIERPTTVTLTANSAGLLPSTTQLIVIDDDLPRVTITLASTQVSEGSGPNATQGTVTRDKNSPRPLVVLLSSDTPSAALVPASVTIPAGQTQIGFSISTVDDTLVDGTQSVSIQGIILDSFAGLPVGNATSATLLVTDDDGPALSISLSKALVGEGLNPATSGTITRNNGTSGNLNVLLTSSDISEATVPPSIVIPNGSTSATFAVQSLNDGSPDGNQSLTIQASAAGFVSSSVPLVVTDTDLPDLAFSNLTTPTNALTDALVDVTFRLSNQGLSTAGTNFTQRILLSSDPVPGDDTILSQATFNGQVPVGLFFEQTARVRMPRTPGTYWIVVVADVNNQVVEGLENNNSRVSSVPVIVERAYTATAIVDPEVVPAGTPVVIRGQAKRAGIGAPAAFEPVNIHLRVRNTQRVISAITDAAGNFSTTFAPLPNEAGNYSVAADHPGVSQPQPQDAFTILGLQAENIPTLRVLSGTSTTNIISVRNLGNTPLSGLTATTIAGPANLSLSSSFIQSTVPADDVALLRLVVTSPADLSGSSTFRIAIQSSEGARGEFDLPVVVESLQPRLVATPSQLSGGMRRGGSTSVQFTLANQGGASSGPLSVLLPPLPWMAVSAGAAFPPLAPGSNLVVTLSLTPPNDLPLGDHSGSIVVQSTNTSTSIPFTFRSLSDNTGILLITAIDELTFYAEGSPKLTNASIRLIDPVTGATTLSTNLNGRSELVIPNLPEAFYTLRMEAPNHASYQETFLLQPAITNEVAAFLSRQTVRYTWTVEPILIEDRYQIVVETTFETAVPLPVITVEPQVIDFTQFPGTTKQVNVTIRNHGLLAAQNMRLDFPSHPKIKVTPLIQSIGELPAQSSLTIPVIFEPADSRRLSDDSGSGGDTSCQLGGKIEWTIDCAGQQITHVVPLAAINLDEYGVQCGTSARSPFPTIPFIPGGLNFASIGGGLNQPGYSAPISFAEKSVCDPCLQKIGRGLLQNCLPLLPLPIFDDEVGPQEPCESGAGTAQQFVSCMQDALEDLEEVVSEPLDKLGDLGESLGDDGEDVSDAVDKTKNGLETVKDILDKLNCLTPLLNPCVFGGAAGPGGGPTGGGGGPTTSSLDQPSLADTSTAAGAPITAPLTNRIVQALAYLGRHTNIFGSDLWFRGTNANRLTNWLASFRQRTSPTSENGQRLTISEQASLNSLPLPESVTPSEAQRFMNRWNRTLDYYDQRRFSATNVPAGQSLDFIAQDERKRVLATSRAAHQHAVAEGFRDVAHAFNFTRQEILNLIFADAQGGICAKVRLRLEQEAVISRDAFQARLEIENNTASPLSEIGVNLLVTDESGANRTDLFQIRTPTLDGISSIDGTGLLPGQSTGSSAWFLIPAPTAAPTNQIRYFVSGSLTYVQDGTKLTIPLSPTPITVLPSPRLLVDYFHERDVFSDDPFTPEIEPSIPYSLGIRIRNEGFGAAKNFRITSAQPEIVDNEKGLFIHFEILATEVGGKGQTPALTAEFGDILPNSTTVGRWIFRSSLQGLFTSYDARFEHVSGLGDRRFSLIDSVNIHEMIHLVQADRSLEDGLPDFLVNDLPDLRDLPDTLHFSQGGQAPVQTITNAVVDGPVTTSDLSVTLSANLPQGWAYLRLIDPATPEFRLREVVRADNSKLSVNTNVWRTDRTFIGFGKRPIRENILHLLDFNSSATSSTYTLVYESLTISQDTNAPSSSVAILPPNGSPSFPITWSGTDTPNGSGIAFFDIFVSDNGAPFTNWLPRTTATGAIFDGAAGRTYAFFSRATDAAGNLESAPLTPDTQILTLLTNRPPSLAFPSSLNFDEGSTVSFNMIANDPDSGQTLQFELLSTAPAGLVLNPTTGKVTFPTSEGTGPTSIPLTIQVRDNGAPALSATASSILTIRELNQHPILAPIPDQLALEGLWLRITNSATDADLPPNQLTFTLGAGAPANAAIDPDTGIFRWNPTEAQTPSTNIFTILVTDNGVPPLGDSRSFTVVARRPRSYFTMSLGTTNVFPGMTSSVPVNFITGFDLAEARAQLTLSGGNLNSLNLHDLASEVILASLEPLNPTTANIRFVFNNLPLNAERSLALLGFTAPNAGDSALVRLNLDQPLSVLQDGATFTKASLQNGWVAVVVQDPILVAEAGVLRLFGRPGRRYIIEQASRLLDPPVWTEFQRLTLEDVSTEITPATRPSDTFYRVRDLDP